jgi:glycosyltransferase involved in cell wall biosynthesis
MPSYLGFYPRASSNREEKFIRACASFQVNTHPNKSLVIVSDGCLKTVELYNKNLSRDQNMYLVQIGKQPAFSGNVRNLGLSYARKVCKADIICYLDSDDVLMKHHLQAIVDQINDFDWVYYDDFLHVSDTDLVQRNAVLQKEKVGTSNIAHRSRKKFNWKRCDGYFHDWKFIKERLMAKSNNYGKIQGCGYVVHHVMGWFDN